MKIFELLESSHVFLHRRHPRNLHSTPAGSELAPRVDDGRRAALQVTLQLLLLRRDP